MFDIGWTELLVVAVVAILVVGPKELPSMLMTFGRTVGRMRRMANEFQSHFNDALKEAERQANLDEVRKDIEGVTDPFKSVRHTLDPKAGAKMPDEKRSSADTSSDSAEAPAAETKPADTPASEPTETPTEEKAPPPQQVASDAESALPVSEPQRDAAVGGGQRT
ncbi:Sec-independent protein translocase protein TatB [Amorphus sp. 3PC139-8]|uniref:Sec-independent protein translocase protein TatB n=1 Tax=Amorphus sp. 3PC139-8 TaxID=2735676 RepID=UPI00345D0B0D